MATLFKPMDVQVDGNGVSMAGAKLYFYTTGTSTPQDTYSQSDLDPSHVNPNPVVADANGLWPAIYMGATDYKAILKTAADVTLQTLDPVLVNPAVASLSDEFDGEFGSTQYSLLQRGASAWQAVTLKAVLDNKFGTAAGKVIVRGASDWTVTNLCQVASTITGAVATGTTQMPGDDSIPQNTEGDEYMTLAFTPGSATSKLVIDVQAIFGCDASDIVSMALFQDSTAGALAASGGLTGSGGFVSIAIRHVVTSGSTSARTYKVRAGPNSGNTVTFNGIAGVRIYGGVAASSIVVREYPVVA